MTLLVPGIRKKDEHFVDARIRKSESKYFDGVMRDDTHIGEIRCRAILQQTSDAGPVHFDAKIVDLRIGARQRTDHLANAESDLHATRRMPAECGIQVQRFLLEVDAESRP